eukprot:scaffold4712_cov98-Isochrysis_galbana.AAC.2
MGSYASGVSVEWATRGVLESLALSGSGDVLDSLRASENKPARRTARRGARLARPARHTM